MPFLRITQRCISVVVRSIAQLENTNHLDVRIYRVLVSYFPPFLCACNHDKCIVVTKVRISPRHFCVGNVLDTLFVGSVTTQHFTTLTFYNLKNWSVHWPIFTTRQWSWGKVMFSYVSVCLLVHRRVPSDRQPCCIGPHCTGAPWTWGLTELGSPLAPAPLLNMGPHWTGIPDPNPSTPIWDLTGQVTTTVQTCSVQTRPTVADIWWLLKLVRSAQVGSTHPTGILSCSLCFCKFVLNHQWRTSCLHTVKQNVNVTSLHATSILNSDVCDLENNMQAGSRLHDISSYMGW